jgi:putative transposase
MNSGPRRHDAAESGVRPLEAALESGGMLPQSKDWPHAPIHRLDIRGIYMVTAGTYLKSHHLNTPERLELAMQMLFSGAREFEWELHAWAILSNHYHFVARSPAHPASLRRMMGKLHMTLAKELNRQDGTPGRKVWYQYWDSLITHERSYLARLKYVHYNPQHHRVVLDATTYRWCSAAWFIQTASPAFAKTLASFQVDRLKVPDDF